jgi:hypothetical protein
MQNFYLESESQSFASEQDNNSIEQNDEELPIDDDDKPTTSTNIHHRIVINITIIYILCIY